MFKKKFSQTVGRRGGGGSFCEIERLQSQNTTFYKRFMQDRALWVSESGHTLEKGQKNLLLQ